MSATAEFGGYDRSQSPKDFNGIIAAGNELFPDALDLGHGRVSNGSSSDDSGWASVDRPRKTGQPLLQHRARARRLDDGMRFCADVV